MPGLEIREAEAARSPVVERIVLILFLLLVFSLGFMQPSTEVAGFPIPLTDGLFLIVFAIWAAAVAAGRLQVRYDRILLPLALFALAAALSAIFSTAPSVSYLKLAGTFYLVLLAVLTLNVVRTGRDARFVIYSWLTASTIVSVVGLATVLLFYTDRSNPLLAYTLHHYGSLTPGNYPRIQSTFVYPAMLCNYLSVSIMMLFGAKARGWIGRSLFAVLLVIFAAAAAFTITPGLGGIVLGIAIWVWTRSRKPKGTIVLAAGITAASLFLIVSAFSLRPIPTSPFHYEIAGLRIDPTQRFLTWYDALRTFLADSVVGRGWGTNAAEVYFMPPSGQMQILTDAHNTWLSIAAQSGIIGLSAIVYLSISIIRRSFPARAAALSSPLLTSLGIAFISAFVYQGLTGSYEDARHLWVLIGLIPAVAATRMNNLPQLVIKCTLIRLLAWINSLYISGGSVFKNFRYPFFALLVFALTVSWLVYGSWNFRSEAGPPAYWITVADSELEHISSLNAVGFNVVERRSGLAIAKVDELQLADLSRAMHTEFHKCAGFIRHETYDEALKSVNESLAATTESQFVAYSIDNQSAVTPMLAEAQEPRIRQTITELSALPNRRHDQQGGTDGANYIYSKWRLLALGRNDISVYPYAHQSPTNPDVFLTPQPSIIMSIQGTEFPNEIVVVGGHQDSINSSGGATGVAPGADDDASGIASITETIRVLIAKGFRPKRTVQFMAYAAEEVGLVGSKNIAENYRAQNKNVIGVVQLDMTNFAGTWADIVLMTDNTNAAQNQFLRDLVAAYQPSLVVKNDVCGYGCSDHKSWHDKQYPASMPFEAKFSGTTLDGIPRQYNTMIHTTSDTLSRSNNNADHALKFTKLAVSFVGELAKGSIAQVPVRSRFDFDGDGKSDISVFRPGVGVWHLNRSTAGYTASQFGISTDVIVPADYDGDGKADIAVYRDGVWHLLRSQAGYTSVLWGIDSDVPQSGDFDGDGTDDLAVFRPSNGTWYIRQSSAGELVVPFGADGDRPVASDYDGDGKTDPAVYRDGIWHLLRSTSGYAALQFGVASDRPITGDFDGDGKSDPVVYRDGFWHTLGSAGGYSVVQWGIASDRPSAGDFDGDGKMDISVFREGTWYILNSSNGSARFEQFGTVNDVPTEAAYIQ